MGGEACSGKLNKVRGNIWRLACVESIMRKRLVVCLWALFPAYAAPPVSNRYALFLEDPPVSRFYQAREAMFSPAAATYRRQIRASHAALRADISARGLHVSGEADTLLNAVFVTAPPERVAELAGLPGVAGIVPLRTYKMDLNQAVNLVDAPAAWTALGGVGNAGMGIKIGILDSGIDQTHPAFQDAGLVPPPGYPICAGSDCAFTSNKVIVARSYVKMLAAGSSASNPAADSRPDDVSPRDRTGHGTAVASVAAGNTTSGLVTITGMAPHAFLGNYRIFGSPGVNDTTSDDVIIAAAEDAIADGMDMISLSLGAPAFSAPLDSGAVCGQSPGVPCDPLASAMEAAVKGGMIVVVAAGNNGQTGLGGPGYNTISSPGDAPSVITVGASTNSHMFPERVSVTGTSQSYNAFLGNGTVPPAPLTAPGIDLATLGIGTQACAALPAGSLSGAIALIERGNCTFLVKLQNAIAAGAIGVIFYMADGSTPITPGGLGGTATPAVMISNADGTALQNLLDVNAGQTVTIDPAQAEQQVTLFNQLASFSSQGPVAGSNALKPEVVAPGTNLYMAAQSYDALGALFGANGYTVANGTSFATPLVTGAAAMVKQSHPGWTPAQVKSALVNTATQDVTQDDAGHAVTAQSIGAGKLDAGAAVASTVTADPATLSFGVLTSLPMGRQIVLTNSGNSSVTLAVGNDNAHAAASIAMAFSQSTITLAPGASSTLTVTLSGGVPAGGSYAGAVTIQGAGVSLRIPYLYLTPTGVAANLLPIYGDGHDGTVGDTMYVLLKLVDANGVPVASNRVIFSTSPGARVVAATAITDSNGIAEAEVSLGFSPGVNTITASAAGLHYAFTASARAMPTVALNGFVNVGSSNTGIAAAPGSFIAIYGSALSDFTDSATTARLPMSIDQVTVSFDVPGAGISVPGHLTFVSPSQINVQVPWELAGQTSAQVKVAIDYSYSNVVALSLATFAPGFYESSAGVVSALDANYKLVNASNAAVRGQPIVLYASGLGPVSNTPASGDPASGTVLSDTTQTPTVTIGGQAAQVLFSGLAPGFTGVYQLNVIVPPDVPAGTQPIVLSIGGQFSKTSTIAVQ